MQLSNSVIEDFAYMRTTIVQMDSLLECDRLIVRSLNNDYIVVAVEKLGDGDVKRTCPMHDR